MLVHVNCPTCGYFNAAGSTQCFQCNLVLPTPVSSEAHCAAHPEKLAVGACSRCGTFGCAACLTQRGDEWFCPACFERVGALAWDDRDSLGMWRAWWRTSLATMGSPNETFVRANPDASYGSSVKFATLSTIAGTFPTLLIYLIIVGFAVVFGLSQKKGGAAMGGGEALILLLLIPLVAVMTVVFQIVGLFFSAALDHLGLTLVGANPKSFQVTVRANALAMGPYVVGLLPFCSLYVYPLWSLGLRVVANAHLHRISIGRAAAGVLLPTVAFCGIGLAAYAALIVLAQTMGR